MSQHSTPEMEIERAYDNRCAKARSIYHMVLGDAEDELERALASAEAVRQAELRMVRQDALKAVDGELAGQMALPFGVTRLTEIEA